jgi:hypothetical protein
VITVLFAFIFKVLPSVPLHWGDVTLSAVLTSLLFAVGKFLLGVYLGKAAFTDRYGAAGSLTVVLVWAYYSAQVLYLGAEFTRVYASRFGSMSVRKQKRRPRLRVLGLQAMIRPHGGSQAQTSYAYLVQSTSSLSGRWNRRLDGSFQTIPGDRPKLPGALRQLCSMRPVLH